MELQKLIDSVLAKEQEEKNKRIRSQKFSPSMFGRCYRAQIWNRRDEPVTNPPDARSLRLFKAGKLFHDFAENLLPKHQREVLIETKDIKGFADIVGERAVIDIKSQHSKGFWYMKGEGYDITKEKYPNWLQVGWYAMELKKPIVGLLFVSKDDLCIQEYYMDTKKWLGEVKKELTFLRECWKTEKLPSTEPRAYGGREKKFCLWRDKCGEECR